jgi:hypothetical protein
MESVMWRGLVRRAAADASQTTEQRELRAFSVMRGSSERMPVGTVAHLRSTVGAPPGSFDLRDTQRAHTAHGNLSIVNGQGKGRGVTCIVQRVHGYVGCTTTADFVEHGLALGIAKSPAAFGGNPRSFYVLGVAPDWVKSVEVKMGANARLSVPVRGNAYTTPPASVPVLVERFCRRMGEECQSP